MDIEDIRAGLKKPGKSKSGLAAALGRLPSTVTAILKGEREIKAREVPVIANYLGLNIDPNSVPVMGRIGAGGAVEPDLEQVAPDGLYTVELPFALPDEMIGFEVRGESMLPRYDDGDVIVVWKEQRRPIESFYGQEAAVLTKDGHRFLKTIMAGRSRSVVSLYSFNARPIENVKIEWVGEVFITVRRGQLRRLNGLTKSKR